MKKLIFTLLMLISSFISAQTLSENGCGLVATIAADAVLVAQKKATKEEVLGPVELNLPRASDPGRFYEYIDYLYNKYSKLPKSDRQAVFDKELKRCYEASGDLDKLILKPV